MSDVNWPAEAQVLWKPPARAWERSRIGRFAAAYRPSAWGDYELLWRWSVEDPSEFWEAVWDFFSLESSTPIGESLTGSAAPDAKWFTTARLNYAAHALRGNGLSDDDVAVVAESQTHSPSSSTLGELREQVRRARAGLQQLGIRRGDRVAAYLPNIPETLVAFLATASLGAIWTSCAPDFGTRAVIDRWSQVEPTVLLAADGYRYGNRDVDRTEEVKEIRESLPSLRHTVLLAYLDTEASIQGTTRWDALLNADADLPLDFVDVPFDHPLFVVFSSGTTGPPKPIVHGHGGILLEHVKMLGLHLDLGPGDRFFWFSTTGWMMWNLLVSGLLVGAAVVLFDGDPAHPDLDTIWALAERTQTSYLGLSAPFLTACARAGMTPGHDHDLSAVTGIGSTGAPLPPEGFTWFYRSVATHAQLGSLSGGTDVCTAFVGPAPVLPVRSGRIPGRMLGCQIESYDPDGKPTIGMQGELVITSPRPSMPIGFWNDVDGSRYRESYYSTYPGVWRHGDWITIHADGSCVITGRSDATLNRSGVRLGTAEFYAVVESIEGVADSLVVHLEDTAGGSGELILFVATQPARSLDGDLRGRIHTALRTELSPRHVPDALIAMPSVPRTLSGKKLEVPVKRIIAGTPLDSAVSTGALADPDALLPYVAWARTRGRATPIHQGS